MTHLRSDLSDVIHSPSASHCTDGTGLEWGEVTQNNDPPGKTDITKGRRDGSLHSQQTKRMLQEREEGRGGERKTKRTKWEDRRG